VKAPILDGRQESLFKPDVSWSPPTELPDLSRMDTVSLDTETYDPNLKERGAGWCRNDGHVVGISVSWPENGKAKALYAPFRHEGGDNLNPDNVKVWINHFFKNFKGLLIGQNLMYDVGWLWAENIDLSRLLDGEIQIRDVMFCEALLDENKRSYALDSTAKTYGFELKEEGLLREAAHSYGVDPKSGIFRLPARFVGQYAERDAQLPLQIYARQKKLLDDNKLEKVTQLEHDLFPCLLTMKKRGVRVDVDKAQQHREMFLKNYEELLGEIKHETGLPIEVFSADSVAKGFDHLSITYPKTGRGKASFTDDWLSNHASKLAGLVTQARKQQRAAETFCKGMVLDKQVNGRIHPDFHPLRSDAGGSGPGRFSSSQPNLQQVPARDPKMGTLIRGLFLGEVDESWAAIDYRAQEPRIQCHFAEAHGCKGGKEAAERYRQDPATDYHGMIAELVFGKDFTKQQRTMAKTLNLSLSYGAGPAKLCKMLGLPTIMMTGHNGRQYETAGTEGAAIMTQYHAAVPFVKELSAHFQGVVNKHGALRTISGRLSRFPFFEPRNGGRAVKYDEAARLYGENNIRRAFTYAALNKAVQGSAADMVKIAMRNLYREGFVPLVTVHDELGMSVKNKAEAKKISEIMCGCVKLRVPLLTDIDLGSSWGSAKPMVEDEAT
jgi:Mesyanzhinovviridae DNA polymerase